MTDLILELHVGVREVGGFDCGNPGLNEWLLRHAPASHRADLARTFLAIDRSVAVPSGGAIAGYFSITTGSVRADDAPKRFSRGMPRYPIGTIVLARLAVDRRYQGRGVGSRLLAEALRRAIAASDTAAARLVVVDAIDEAAGHFYRRWGFIDTPKNPDRLYRKMSDIRRSLTEEQSL